MVFQCAVQYCCDKAQCYSIVIPPDLIVNIGHVSEVVLTLTGKQNACAGDTTALTDVQYSRKSNGFDRFADLPAQFLQ
jgi:hypothetical protein